MNHDDLGNYSHSYVMGLEVTIQAQTAKLVELAESFRAYCERHHGRLGAMTLESMKRGAEVKQLTVRVQELEGMLSNSDQAP